MHASLTPVLLCDAQLHRHRKREPAARQRSKIPRVGAAAGAPGDTADPFQAAAERSESNDFLGRIPVRVEGCPPPDPSSLLAR